MSEETGSGKARGLMWIGLSVVVAGLFAAGLNGLVDLIPFSIEEKLAEKIPEFPATLCKSSRAAHQALDKMRERLSIATDKSHGQISFKLHLVEDPEVNAFAFIGGNIYVNSGLLKEAQSAEEVAGVLAHEMAHVANRDVAHSVAGQLLTALLLSQFGDSTGLTNIFTRVTSLQFTKRQENKADQDAMARLIITRIDPKPVGGFFKRLESGHGVAALLSDHPDSDQRAALADRTAALVKNPQAVLTADEWIALKTACL